MPSTKLHTVAKPAGVVIEVGPDLPGQVHSDTVMCCHCGKHWVFRAGSGNKRGFCSRCNAITCGAKECDPCRPIEHQLEEIEAAAATIITAGS